MKKFYLVAITIVSTLFISGCGGEPSFNLAYQHIVMVDGKPFRIPSQSQYIRSTRATKFCKKGQLRWVSNSTTYHMNKMAKDGRSSDTITYFIKQEGRIGKAGCARPISNQEYHFYHNKEVQAAADYRAAEVRSAAVANERASRRNLQAAQTAKDINVNVSGTINHDVYHSGTINHNVNVYGY